MTELIEFQNHKKEILRGLLDKANNKKGVIFMHGFERTTVEMKFKNIVDQLKGKINMLRFDFSGCGLSDGRFNDITAAKLTKELGRVVAVFRNKCKLKDVILVAHSFAACVVLQYLTGNKGQVFKAVFMAPAFNQRELHRFWFAGSINKNKEITWNNYKRHYQERDFVHWMQIPKRLTKSHMILNKYFLENKEKDYQELFDHVSLPMENIIIIHGESDDKVPVESNNKLPPGIGLIKVKNGDHDLERVNMVSQYLVRVVKFILS